MTGLMLVSDMAVLSYAGRFFDGESAKAGDVQVSIDPVSQTLRLDPGQGVIIWKLDQVQLFPSAEKGHCRLGVSAMADARLIIRDPAFLEAMDRCFPNWQKQAKTGKSDHRLLVVWLVVALVIGGGAWFALPTLSGALASLIPAAWEENIGRTITRSMDEGFGRCTSADGKKALEKMTARLSASPMIRDVKFRIEVVDNGQVNAVALPGGNIRIFRGLLRDAAGPDEVAGVLAHEMGHVAERHVMEGLIEQVGMAALAEMLTGGGGEIAAVLTRFRYSKEKEQQADEFAVALMQDRQIDAAPLAGFFDRLAVIEKDASSKKTDPQETAEDGPGFMKETWDDIAGFFRTHPDSVSRSAYIQRLTKKDGATQPVLTADEWDILQSICDSIERNPAESG